MGVNTASKSRRTKYFDVVIPKIRKFNDQHIFQQRSRIQDSEDEDDEIFVPCSIGRHVMDQEYHPPRRSASFRRLQPEDLFFPLTSLKEWDLLDQEGIEATDTLLTGERFCLP